MTAPAIKSNNLGLELNLNGESLFADPRGCLFWPKEQLLVVSDLHLEKGSSLAVRRGIMIPPYDTHVTLETLALCIADWQPKTVVSLGDSFHDDDASARLPQSCYLALAQLMEAREWIWISGNHDPTPPEQLGGTFCSEMSFGNLNFVHEPQADFNRGEIAGHLHPAAKLRIRGKTLRRRCFAGDGERLILPAFGAFTGGLNLADSAFEDLFVTEKLHAYLMSNNSLYQIAGHQLMA